MTRIRRVLVCTGALALTALVSSSVTQLASAADPASETAAASAAAWLKTQVQPDGSFEHTTFTGFETTDAVIAIVEQAQTGVAWSTAEAFAAVAAIHGTDSGAPTPLDWLEGFIAGAADNGVPAKNIVLVALPLGIDPTAFGSLDLVAEMGGCTEDETLGFNGLLYLTLAQQLACGARAPTTSRRSATRNRPTAVGTSLATRASTTSMPTAPRSRCRRSSGAAPD